MLGLVKQEASRNLHCRLRDKSLAGPACTCCGVNSTGAAEPSNSQPAGSTSTFRLGMQDTALMH